MKWITNNGYKANHWLTELFKNTVRKLQLNIKNKWSTYSKVASNTIPLYSIKKEFSKQKISKVKK